MANRHYARIGDVWKHLPLLEVLALEPPGEYWETHSGAALYPLTHSPDRDYGVFRFVEEAATEPLLQHSSYLRELTKSSPALYPHHYPGSADLALRLLGTRCERYLFCEIDRYSLETLRDAAATHDVADRAMIVDGDGMDTAWTEISEYDSATRILVHIDPLRSFRDVTDPPPHSAGLGQTSL